MSDRFVVSTFQGDFAVIDTGKGYRQVIATCGVRADAEKIVAALNAASSEKQV